VRFAENELSQIKELKSQASADKSNIKGYPEQVKEQQLRASQ
jgi:hypothetical protein